MTTNIQIEREKREAESRLRHANGVLTTRKERQKEAKIHADQCISILGNHAIAVHIAENEQREAVIALATINCQKGQHTDG
jgi:hypothetical protein